MAWPNDESDQLPPPPPPPGPGHPPAAPDPFDPASLRLTGDLMGGLGIKKALLTVPVRKPDKSWFVRVCPDEAYTLQTGAIELKQERGAELYLVASHLWPELAGESTFRPIALHTAINRQGTVYLWPTKLPGPDGRLDDWSGSALEAVAMARTRWVRVTANMNLGAYDVYEATGSLPEPEWPTAAFSELLRTAFKGRLIDTHDHPVLRQLRGEA